jgi:protein involved in polysaccharide export with SLBB domain
LRRLLLAKEKANVTPQDALGEQPPQFPPVPPPPAAVPALMDSIAEDSTAAESSSEYFGYEIFTMSPKTFEPLAFGPVSPDYLVGPGDEIIVTVWGAQEMNARIEVNSEGYILLPDLGQVLVNGYTLRGLKEPPVQRLSKIYSGLHSDGGGRTFLDVSIGKLRSIQVFVLGDVVQPGGYTMSSTSTVMNALYYAGGPTLQGSMRSIRVMRGNKRLREIDLYDYVAQGDGTHDARLENGDVIFVPPIGIRVKLEGEVQHPAIYELHKGEMLRNLLELAGGLKSTAYPDRVQIERTIPFEERPPLSQEDRRILDLNLREENAEQARLVDGDIVRVFRVGAILKNTVQITGRAVYKAGTYEYQPGMTVADLVTAAGGLLGDAYTGWAHLVRTLPDKTKQLVSFDLNDALQREPSSNLVLPELDVVQIFSVWDIRDKAYVSIEGHVRKPGRYELLEGTKIEDLIVRAGGLRESAFRLHADVARIDPESISDGGTTELIQVSMQGRGDSPSDAAAFRLQKNDIVFIREIPNWSLQENVWITGEVRFPGKYSLTSKTERLGSVIERAGGLEDTAYLRGATFLRKKDETGRMAIDFEQALKRRKKDKPDKYALVMVAGDSVHIPLAPTTVKVTGQVGFPSSVLWEKGRDVDYYIEQAGGLLQSADSGKIRVLMANGRIRRPGWFRSPEPDAGATVIVPTQPEKQESNTLKNMAQIVSILSGAATTIYLIARTTD